MEPLTFRGRLAGVSKRKSGCQQDCSTDEREAARGKHDRVRTQARIEMIEHLEQALVLADELHDGATQGYLIECALDKTRSKLQVGQP